MGHIRLGVLPRTRQWREVIGLIAGGAGTAEIAAATLNASKYGLRKASEDPGFVRSAWLLTQIPLAARSPEFVERLRAAGLSIPDRPSLLDVVVAFTRAIDAHLRQCRGRTDIGEMAQLAAVESITRLVTDKTRTIFGTTTEDVQDALRSFSTTKQFGVLSRDFFARFSRRYLLYFLSRELSNHVGGERRFANIYEHSEFHRALDHHCYQAALIVEQFAGEWTSKTNYERGGISPEDSARFVHVALNKLRDELLRGGTPAGGGGFPNGSAAGGGGA